jgi:hypothetical protein
MKRQTLAFTLLRHQYGCGSTGVGVRVWEHRYGVRAWEHKCKHDVPSTSFQARRYKQVSQYEQTSPDVIMLQRLNNMA